MERKNFTFSLFYFIIKIERIDKMGLELDKEQLKVVNSKAKYILVIANAGAGKTRCLTERVLRLINEGESPQGIVAITFTNAAADEMKQRLGEKCTGVFIGTIHSYINQILIQNKVDTSTLLQEERFDELLDMLLARPGIVNNLKINHLLVDECQDLDERQYTLLKEQFPAKNKLFVGDDWQMIYAFRGSNFEYIRQMYDDPKYTVYYLYNNYRCGTDIIRFSNQFMNDVLDKIERGTRPARGCNGEVYTVHNLDEALSYIKEFDNFNDWLVLTRTNEQITDIRENLRRMNIPTDTFKKSEITAAELSEKMKSNTVKVLTAHAAKGLEAKNVIVYGLIPYDDDERRLCYVACTRAADRLFWCKKRTTNKRKGFRKIKTPHGVDIFEWE